MDEINCPISTIHTIQTLIDTIKILHYWDACGYHWKFASLGYIWTPPIMRYWTPLPPTPSMTPPSYTINITMLPHPPNKFFLNVVFLFLSISALLFFMLTNLVFCRVELDDYQSSKKGSHTDPLPVHQKVSLSSISWKLPLCWIYFYFYTSIFWKIEF